MMFRELRAVATLICLGVNIWLHAACPDAADGNDPDGADSGAVHGSSLADGGSHADQDYDSGTEDGTDGGGATEDAGFMGPDSGPDGGADNLALDGGSDDGGQIVSSQDHFAFYSATRIHSPLNTFALERLNDIYAAAFTRADDVFMKAGASSTVSSRTLHCFVDDDVDLGNAIALSDTLDYFLMGDAAGSTPFDRHTIAALSGHSAGWVISGEPSPLQEELDLLNPRFGFVHYGTNDMGLGSTYASAMPNFYSNMMELLTVMMDQGVIPIVFGISPRLDSENADRWVDAYNALIRGMAQAFQIPFVDLHLATLHQDGFGMASDGIHLNYYSEGACILTDAALEYGYNMRNLIALESLDRMNRYLLLEEELPEEDLAPLMGQGTSEEPWMVHELPYADFRDTRDSTSANLDYYVGCESTANETGPEWVYQLTVEEQTSIRAVVMDLDNVDIDIHLLGATVTEESCLLRGHRLIEATLEPGTYHFVLDSWVDASDEVQSGEFLFLVVPCRDDDSDCSELVGP